MTPTTLFFLVFVGTIVVTRLVLLPKRILYPRVFGHHIHHFIYGIFILIIGVLASNLFLYAVGFGLFVDELPLVFTQKWNWNGYNSALCPVGEVGIIILAFLLRNYILLPLK